MVRMLRVMAISTALLGATAVGAATNLVPNGNFEAGNTGFISDYAYAPAGNSTEGQYSIVTNTSPWNPLFWPSSDHTTGTGGMFVGNGSSSAGQVVWQSAPITIAAGLDYFFEAFVLNACCTSAYTGANSAPVLTFSIALDGGTATELDTLTIPLSPPGVWYGLSTNFNSGTATSAVLSLVNANTAFGGNDFAVDDIFLGTESTVLPVPEPTTWAMMLSGFGLLGAALRRRARPVAASAA